jgi:hypothetical protein
MNITLPGSLLGVAWASFTPEGAVSSADCVPKRPQWPISIQISTPFIDRFRNACYC